MRKECELGTGTQVKAHTYAQWKAIDRDALDGILTVPASSAVTDQEIKVPKLVSSEALASAAYAKTPIDLDALSVTDDVVIEEISAPDQPEPPKASPLPSVMPSENQDALASHPPTTSATPESKGIRQTILRLSLVVAIGLILASLILSNSQVSPPAPQETNDPAKDSGLSNEVNRPKTKTPVVVQKEKRNKKSEPKKNVLILPLTFNTGAFRTKIDIDHIYSMIAPLAKNKSIVLIGHTDSRGNSKLNYQLGLKRAAHIKKLLVLKGISSDKIRVESRGANEPLSQEDTEEGLALNRRVEVRIDTK